MTRSARSSRGSTGGGLRGGNASIKWRWGGARVERAVMTRRRSVPRDYRRQARQSFRNYECEGKQRARRRASQHDGNKSRRDWSPPTYPLSSPLLLFHSSLRTELMHCQSRGGGGGERAKSRIAHIVISVISIYDDEIHRFSIVDIYASYVWISFLPLPFRSSVFVLGYRSVV